MNYYTPYEIAGVIVLVVALFFLMLDRGIRERRDGRRRSAVRHCGGCGQVLADPSVEFCSHCGHQIPS